MTANQIYTVCVSTTYHNCSNPAYICPILNCSGGTCGCILTSGTSKTDVSCNGGSDGTATVTATGGLTPTYLWSNSKTTATITGLTAATYTVTVTSNGGACTTTETVTL
ncbi:MAG: SprB repeat-containing protein [Flavobacteriales bacterium]|nr:SprB repeat-containing protein [Flavobacteriales bacterium]MCB9449118.1 SprB repeat-containing protein [Flavobacteriales bacterium]